jgi:hypothetical protein
MPLPLIPLIIGVGAGALGIGKGIKAAIDNDDAKELNAKANNTIDKAKNHLEVCRDASKKVLEVLGRKKALVLNQSIRPFVRAFEKLQNVDFSVVSVDGKIIDKQFISDLRQMGDYASSLLSGMAGGTVGGALVAFGAYSGVMAFGAASTGTAIATLSGAAATNATLAFLGGGSLAAGGLGMAGGMAVLGGLVAGPALAIMGFVVGAKASENLDKARSNLAEARKIAEELNTAVVLCNGIRRRSYMFERLLIQLDILFSPLVFQMDHIITVRGVDWRNFQADEKNTIAAATSLAKTIKTVLDTPILSEDGKLTDVSKQVVRDVKGILDERTKP